MRGEEGAGEFVTNKAEATLVDVFWRRVAKTPDRTAIMFKQGGSYQNMNWKTHGEKTSQFQRALMACGVEPQSKVGIMSQNRPEWTWADMAILSCKAVTVPIYPTLNSQEACFQIDHADLTGIFVENEKQLAKILESLEIPHKSLKFIAMFEGDCLDKPNEILIYNPFDFPNLGKGKIDDEALVKRREAVNENDLASIVFTSGTTGVPKGAMLLHRNIYAVLKDMCELCKFNDEDVALSFLPFSHVYERVGGQFLTIFQGIPLAYAESMENVPQNLAEVKPTVLNAVPRFYEKAYQRVQAQIRHLPAAQQSFTRWAIGIGMRATRQKVKGKVAPDILDRIYKTELRIADKLVFSKIRERFGGRLRMMTSGAAPLANEVHIFFEAIGMQIIEGYGLTETCAPLACNTLEDNKFHTVGKALPSCEVKLGKDNELLVRGANVFAGYYKNEEATKEAFDQDGFFKTGDIAEIDDQGYIRITDRKKDIIITSGGKHVAPQLIENLFKGEPLISHVVIYGDRRKFITALISLNQEGIKHFCEKNGVTFNKLEDVIENEKLRAEIDKVVQAKNSKLASFEKIKHYCILKEEFSVENNELTPTMKVKRKVVIEKHKELLDNLYEKDDLQAQKA